MKKTLLMLIVSVFAITVNAQSKWNLGIQLGASGNHSQFSSGMTDANALFSATSYGAGHIGFLARRGISSHFSLQSGIGFSSVGFAYRIAEDYSLLKTTECSGNELRVGTCITRVPVSLIYNSNLNCKNIRFIAGIGFAVGFVDTKWNTEVMNTVEGGELGNTAASVMKTQVRSTNNANGSFTTMLGVEKVFSRGNMLSLTFEGNWGFNKIAESTVNYTVDNKNYNHTFSNSGSYCGVALTYYFLPAGSKKAGRNLPPNPVQ